MLSAELLERVFHIAKQEMGLDTEQVSISVETSPDTVTPDRLEVLKISADGLSATKTDVSWPTATGRFRSAVLGPDGDLYVALEDQGNIIRVTPK